MHTKIAMVFLLFASSLFAADDAQIIKYFKAQIPVPSIEIKVTSRISIDDVDGLEYVSLDISDGSRTQKLSVFTQGDLIFPDVISIKSGGSIKEKMDRQKLIGELAKLYKNEDSKYIITLGEDSSKETLVVFTDPECPFCRKELEKVDDKLKDYNIKLIMTPVHERTALEKSYLIYEEVAKASGTQAKLDIVKKYYAPEVDYTKVSDTNVATMESLRQKYFGAGLKGVPMYVNEKDLL